MNVGKKSVPALNRVLIAAVLKNTRSNPITRSRKDSSRNNSSRKKKEQEQLEQEKLEQERREQEKLEKERLKQERLEQEQLEQEREEKEEASPDTGPQPIISRRIILLIYAMIVFIGYLQIGPRIETLVSQMDAYGDMHEATGRNIEQWWQGWSSQLENFTGMEDFGAAGRAIGDVHLKKKYD